MDTQADDQYRKTAQWLADWYEDIDCERWPAAYATHVELMRAVDEAGRRAASRARLEDALARLLATAVR